MNTSRWALALALLVSPLLLIGGVGEASPRSLSMAWDFGHTILFALLTLGILGAIFQRAKASWGLLWATIGVAVALAIAIEWVQGFVGRERSWTDVALSLAGVALALPFTPQAKVRFPQQSLALLRLVIGVAVILPIIIPIARYIADERAMSRGFPVLSDFATRIQATRWEVTAAAEWLPGEPGEHTGALAIAAAPNRTTSWRLAYFEPDWRGFTQLAMRLQLEGPPVVARCILNDLLHDQTLPHEDSDHFEVTVPLSPGWQTIRIDLVQAQASLRTRTMNLGEMNGLRCFVRNEAAEIRVLIDDVRLER